jgi:hypothetical protein
MHYAKNLKQIFPEMKLRGLVPNMYIHASVSDLKIPTIVSATAVQQNRQTNRGIYKSLTDT